MGLMEDLGAWLDQKRRNVASSVQNPGLLYTRMNEDARQFQQDQRANWGDIKSVVPEVKAAGIKEFNASGQEMAGMAPMGLLGWTAYHGSPHKFDKFDLSKIGTGEGAQAYGHGLYFAENPQVAESYAQAMRPGMARDGFPHWDINKPDGLSAKASEVFDAMVSQSGKTPSQYVEQYRKRGYITKDIADELMAAGIKDAKPAQYSNMYKVDISDAKAPQDAFLQWDKPLSEQPKVAKLLADKFDPTGGEFSFGGGGSMKLTGGGTLKVYDDPDFGRKFVLDMGDKQFRLTEQEARNLVGTGAEGKSVYQTIASRKGSDAAATEYLKSIGIPGIRYLDGGSRGAGSGTMNTVLFDDSLVKILERNGMPVEQPGLLAREPTKFQLAHAEAQRNAALPVAQGGLGLGPQNTAMERAKAMGFNYDLIHGSSNDIKSVDLAKMGSNTSSVGNLGANGPGFYMSELPWHSELYAGQGWGKAEGANLMPLKVRFDNPQIFDATKNKLFGGNTEHPLTSRWWEKGKDGAIVYRPGIKGKEAEIIEAVSNKPENIRSRFAAFDPKKRDSRDLLASMGLLGLLGAGAYGNEQ
jgi:hypothetical protein